ncbi:MAG: hypothetical protein R3C19_11260 [Planctomycetaceae bacterium]
MLRIICFSVPAVVCLSISFGAANQAAEPNEEAAAAASSGDSALAVFERRILPILQSAKPSSCAECHLSGVDLKDYIRSTQRETFAALVSAKLVDIEHVDKSKILEFIERRPEKPNLISDKVRREEAAAFRAWLTAAAKDPELQAAKTEVAIGPTIPPEVIRHARTDRVLASFVENIWTEAGRCAACHSPDRNQKQVEEHGEQVSWIRLNDPAGTMNSMIENGLIDADEPEHSLILMKPTQQVEHGGGQKMVVGDRTYKQFRRFIDDYAAMKHGRYQTAKDLPPESGEVSLVTDIWLKFENVPAKFDKLLLQADLFRMTDHGWSKQRMATSDRPIFGGGNLWQHSLSLTAERNTAWADQIEKQQLPPGRYLIKLYIDQNGKLAKDYHAILNDEDFVGQVEVDSEWPAGYGKMTIVQFPLTDSAESNSAQ